MISVAEASARILEGIRRLPAVTVPTEDSVGKVLAERIVAAITSPPWDNSSMDGYALRGARDSALRAEAIGIDVRARRIKGLVIVGAFAGLAGALFAFSKGGVAPDALSIPRSVDVLVMMLLGGMNALFGPMIGAIAFTWLSDVLARYTDYWRAGVGIAILLIVSVFPFGIGGALDTLRGRVRART